MEKRKMILHTSVSGHQGERMSCFWVLSAHSVITVLWKDKAGCWILVHLELARKWDINHKGPWEINESVLLCNPELKIILASAFIVQIQSSHRDGTTNGHRCCFTGPPIFFLCSLSPNRLIGNHHWQKDSASYRAFPSTEAIWDTYIWH